ncbi:hypothetical protein Tco_0537323 [Tanacetum coccineum]
MLNKNNYIPWCSRLLRYAKSKANAKLLYNSIMHSPYTDEELSKKDLKQMEDDDHAIQTILMGLPEDIYAIVDSCETAQEIWLLNQQMMKGYDIKAQEKKAKLFNEWEMFTFTDGESIKSYYHHFSKYNVVQHARNHVVQNLGIQNVRNHNVLIVVIGIANQNGNGNVIAARVEDNGNGNNGDIEEIEENNINVISWDPNVEHSRGTVDQNPATIEEKCAYFESLYNNLVIEVEKVKTVNRKMRETNADLITELARYKEQEKCFEINQEKYDKLERCYQKFIYQEQCLTEKINALHLRFAKMIKTLNEEIENLNNQLSKQKSTVSYLQEERKKLKTDFKARKEEFLDKQIQAEKKIKELDNILVKMEAAKFVRDLKSLEKEADESLDKNKVNEGFQPERLARVRWSGSRFNTVYPMDWIRCIRVSWSRDHVQYLPESSHTISSIRRIGLLWIRRIELVPFVVFSECRHGYTVSSLMDAAYW